MRPMTHEEAQAVMLEWADLLASGDSTWPDDPDRPNPSDNYSVMVGFDSDGPVILMKNRRQGNVLQWLL